MLCRAIRIYRRFLNKTALFCTRKTNDSKKTEIQENNKLPNAENPGQIRITMGPNEYNSIKDNKISRIHEHEADAFAKKSIGTGKYLIEGLKKLTVSNFGNLTPHPFTVWLSYSHPPVLDRIRALDIAD